MRTACTNKSVYMHKSTRTHSLSTFHATKSSTSSSPLHTDLYISHAVLTLPGITVVPQQKLCVCMCACVFVCLPACLSVHVLVYLPLLWSQAFSSLIPLCKGAGLLPNKTPETLQKPANPLHTGLHLVQLSLSPNSHSPPPASPSRAALRRFHLDPGLPGDSGVCTHVKTVDQVKSVELTKMYQLNRCPPDVNSMADMPQCSRQCRLYTNIAVTNSTRVWINRSKEEGMVL